MNCDELVMNNDMEQGHVRFWDEYGAVKGTFENVAGYNSSTAIKYSKRAQTYYGPEYEARYFMDYRCLEPDSAWEVTAQLKLSVTDANGVETGASCQLGTTATVVACPSVRIVMYDKVDTDVKILDARLLDYDVNAWDPSGFNLFRAQFTVPTSVTELHDVKVIVRDFDKTLDVTIDDLSIHKVETGSTTRA